MNRIFVIATAFVLVGGCAPVSFGGITLGASPGSSYHITQCASILGYSPEAARVGVTTQAIRARSIQTLVRRIQAHASFGSSSVASMDSWRRIAAGEC